MHPEQKKYTKRTFKKWLAKNGWQRYDGWDRFINLQRGRILRNVETLFEQWEKQKTTT